MRGLGCPGPDRLLSVVLSAELVAGWFLSRQLTKNSKGCFLGRQKNIVELRKTKTKNGISRNCIGVHQPFDRRKIPKRNVGNILRIPWFISCAKMKTRYKRPYNSKCQSHYDQGTVLGLINNSSELKTCIRLLSCECNGGRLVIPKALRNSLGSSWSQWSISICFKFLVATDPSGWWRFAATNCLECWELGKSSKCSNKEIGFGKIPAWEQINYESAICSSLPNAKNEKFMPRQFWKMTRGAAALRYFLSTVGKKGFKTKWLRISRRT